MINGDINEFVEMIYMGQELWFIYDGIKYFLQGVYKGEDDYYLDLWTIGGKKDYHWESKHVSVKNYRSCAEEFLDAKIFNGKTFWETEQKIEWVDG